MYAYIILGLGFLVAAYLWLNLVAYCVRRNDADEVKRLEMEKRLEAEELRRHEAIRERLRELSRKEFEEARG